VTTDLQCEALDLSDRDRAFVAMLHDAGFMFSSNGRWFLSRQEPERKRVCDKFELLRVFDNPHGPNSWTSEIAFFDPNGERVTVAIHWKFLADDKTATFKSLAALGFATFDRVLFRDLIFALRVAPKAPVSCAVVDIAEVRAA
jgi:hypothetical protein